ADGEPIRRVDGAAELDVDALTEQTGREDVGRERSVRGGEQRRHAHDGTQDTHALGTLISVERRIFGLENEYGVTCTLRGQRRLSPDEVARYLFRRVVSWGRSS